MQICSIQRVHGCIFAWKAVFTLPWSSSKRRNGARRRVSFSSRKLKQNHEDPKAEAVIAKSDQRLVSDSPSVREYKMVRHGQVSSNEKQRSGRRSAQWCRIYSCDGSASPAHITSLFEAWAVHEQFAQKYGTPVSAIHSSYGDPTLLEGEEIRCTSFGCSDR